MRTFAEYIESLKIYNPDDMDVKNVPKRKPYDPNKGWPVIVTSPGEYEGQEGRLVGNEGGLSKIHMPDGVILYLAVGHEYDFV